MSMRRVYNLSGLGAAEWTPSLNSPSGNILPRNAEASNIAAAFQTHLNRLQKQVPIVVDKIIGPASLQAYNIIRNTLAPHLPPYNGLVGLETSLQQLNAALASVPTPVTVSAGGSTVTTQSGAAYAPAPVATASKLPAWALPVALGGVGLVVLAVVLKGRRRGVGVPLSRAQSPLGAPLSTTLTGMQE